MRKGRRTRDVDLMIVQTIFVGFLLTLILGITRVPVGAEQSPTGAQAVTAATAPALGGTWVGTLEYRDFSSNERVLLPTWVAIAPSPDGYRLDYTYDDGPSKVVRERAFWDISSSKATLRSDRDKSMETYVVTGFDKLTPDGRGTLLFTGRGADNAKPVDVRITLTVRRNLYTFVKEVRPDGGAFTFRDGYTFVRATPPG